ncbi:MAG: hypothetical protein JWO31_398, partial [Phycisphaerales bacterium]|nr:hypothetical protein [Phycisphaerales bacterium]
TPRVGNPCHGAAAAATAAAAVYPTGTYSFTFN